MLKLIRDFLYWRKERNRFIRAIKSILTLELCSYTYNDIILYVVDQKSIRDEELIILAKLLYARSGRGKDTLEGAVSLYILRREED